MIPVVGVSMVRDEADIIAGTLTHMADEVDALLVADNRSIDGTRETLRKLTVDLPVPLEVVDDLDPAYYQSDKMTALAARVAAAYDGDVWIVPFDADEIWYSPAGRIRDVLADVKVSVCEAALYNHFRTDLDVDDPDPFRSMVWRTAQPADLGKVAFRWRAGARIEQGNHGVYLPNDLYRGLPSTVTLQLRHFPYRSAEQFVSKARNGAEAYRLTNLPGDMGAHWRAYGEMLDRYGADYVRGVFDQHFHHRSPTDVGLVRDPAPYLRWQP